MFSMFLKFLDEPRRLLALICAVSIAMLAFGLYLQHVVGLEQIGRASCRERV